MLRKHHDPEVARGRGTGSSSSKAVWDTGSSLYDSYELAAVRRLIDRRLLAAAGVLPLTTDDETPPDERTDRSNKQQAVVAVRPRRKVTLRALFRAVATWAARPKQAPLACACAGMVHAQGGSAVDPDGEGAG
nr:unnamed protein product [Digitaria exilis]